MEPDFRTLDWQPSPRNHHGATAHVRAGDRLLRIDAGFFVYHVRGARPEPVTGVIDAIRRGDLEGMEAHALPVDGAGRPLVNFQVNGGSRPWIDLRLKDGIAAVNARLAGLAARVGDPEVRFLSVGSARHLERESGRNLAR
jgi:hypothetical protein